MTKIQELVENADNAYYATEYDKAIKLYKQVLDLDSDNKHAHQQLKKAELNQSVKSPKSKTVPTEALRLYKRSRSFIAAGDLTSSRKLLQQAIDIADESGVNFPNAKELLENIKNASKAEEFKKKAFEELDTQQWVKAESILNSVINLDPTDDAAQMLLSHLQSLLKAQNLVNQLNSGVGGSSNRKGITKEIREIIELTNETTALSVLWQDVVKCFGNYSNKSPFVPFDGIRVVLILLVAAGLLGGISAIYDWFTGVVIAVNLLGLALILFVLIVLPGVSRGNHG